MKMKISTLICGPTDYFTEYLYRFDDKYLWKDQKNFGSMFTDRDRGTVDTSAGWKEITTNPTILEVVCDV